MPFTEATLAPSTYESMYPLAAPAPTARVRSAVCVHRFCADSPPTKLILHAQASIEDGANSSASRGSQ
jgi:hypothetical protein